MSTHGSWSSYLRPRLLYTESAHTHEVEWYIVKRDAIKNVLQLQRQPCPNSENHTRNDIREFFMTPKGEISWHYKCIWFHSHNTHIIFQANGMLHHCGSMYRMSFIIKCWLFSSCTLKVCSFPINAHFSLWAVHLTYQIWSRFPWWQGGHHELQRTDVWPHICAYFFRPTATFSFCQFLQFLRHLHKA